MTNRIPTDCADQTAGQVRQTRHLRGFEGLQSGVSDLDHVTFGGHADRDFAQPVGLTIVGTQLSHRVDANEAVSAPRAAIFRGFEDECAGTAASKTLVEADRGERIGKQTTHDGNHTIAGIGKLVKLFAAGPGGTPLQVFDAAFAHVRSFTCVDDVYSTADEAPLPQSAVLTARRKRGRPPADYILLTVVRLRLKTPPRFLDGSASERGARERNQLYCSTGR